MFDWIFGSIAGIWIAWNYWSIVPVVVFIVLSVLFYKTITLPINPAQRQSFRENQRIKFEGIPKARRLMRLAFNGVILTMGGILFSISMFKMFSD